MAFSSDTIYWLVYQVTENFDDMFSRFDAMPDRDVNVRTQCGPD